MHLQTLREFLFAVLSYSQSYTLHSSSISQSIKHSLVTSKALQVLSPYYFDNIYIVVLLLLKVA